MREPSSQVDEIARAVIGAAIEVHRILGPGFLESIYEAALCVELTLRGIRFRRQVPVILDYKGSAVGEHRVDLLVEEELIVENKAIQSFAPIHSTIALSYLRATDKQLVLLINYNVPVLKEGIKRVVLS
jgi:GxxExxY protein